MLSGLKKSGKKYLLNVLRKSKAWRNRSFVPKGKVNLGELPPAVIKKLTLHAVLVRTPPLTIDKKIYWKFEKLLRDTPAPTFVVEGSRWRVWGNQGAVITADDRLFNDVSREFEKPDHSIFAQVKLLTPTVLEGTTAVITASGCDMYYHWMFDVLPRIKILNDSGFTKDNIDRYIIDYREIAFQKEALSSLGIPTDKISRSNDHFSYHMLCERLLVPSLPSELDVVSADACTFLVDTFLDKKKKSRFGKRIYLKRTGKRTIVNNAAIEAQLSDLGFEPVECEKFSIREQAAIFHHAEVLIGPHGAAFSNVVFCKPGTKVIEFFSPRWINPCYWTICNQVSASYYYIIGEGAPPDEHSNAKETNADIELSPEKLKKLFSEYLPITKV